MCPSSDRDLDRLREEHTPEAVRGRLEAGPRYSYLRDFVYGAIDGTVTTFAVVAGVQGAQLAPAIVIIMGVANIVGDGFSMAASNFLGSRAELQGRERTRRQEELHVQLLPEGEREEVRQIFASKGFSGPDLERVVEVITSNAGRWVDTMLREEHGLAARGPSPLRAGLATFAAFVLAGLLPLLAYFYNALSPADVADPFLWSAVVTGAGFFAIGALKSRFVGQRWYLSGLETLAVGGIVAGLAYLVGWVLKGLAGAA